MAKKPAAARSSAEQSGATAYALPKRLRSQLPESERAGADAALWNKSGGLCHLCGLALTPQSADADHVVPSAERGETKLSNLYLAHRTCNQARGALPLAVAKPIVRFKAYTDSQNSVTFDDVLDQYVAPFGSVRQPVKVSRVDNDQIQLEWAGGGVRSQLYRDPATGTEYFFADVPSSHVWNDVDVQPRLILYHHVRVLALDFRKHPVHEPSSCRLVLNGNHSGTLLQFDGQHKSTAQILLGRSSLQMKIYIEPDIAMVQSLVVKIQQEIKKIPLTRSDTLAKLGDVIRRPLEAYLATPAPRHTEQGLIASQASKQEQRELAKLYRQELHRLVFFDPENELAAHVKPGTSTAPATDKMVIDKIIKPLVHEKMLDLEIEASGGRDHEREMIVLVLNTIVGKMLPDDLNAQHNELAARRTRNFFYQGSITWWMKELDVAMRYVTQRLKSGTPLFVERLDADARDLIVQVVEKLCDLEVWSTDDAETVRAMRSNTVANLEPLMPKDAFKKLLP